MSLDAHVVVARRDFVLDAHLRAAPGETVAIMGPSGAGKSTLLRAIAGVERMSRGSVTVAGRRVDGRAPAKRRVVLLGQDPRLFPHMSARENVAFSRRLAGSSKLTARSEAEAWLDRVGVPRAAATSELSGGQQQRVALARALASGPAVLLLDEPLTSLDVETAADIREVIADQVRQTQTTTVVVTHALPDAAGLAERLVLLEAGRVTQDGPISHVLASPATRFAAAVAASAVPFAAPLRLEGHAG